MRTFLITYKELKKYSTDMELHRVVKISKETGDIGIDAKAALGVFINSTGTLKKNEIISIQELDEQNNPIGEPIKPVGEDAIVPTGR